MRIVSISSLQLQPKRAIAGTSRNSMGRHRGTLTRRPILGAPVSQDSPWLGVDVRLGWVPQPLAHLVDLQARIAAIHDARGRDQAATAAPSK